MFQLTTRNILTTNRLRLSAGTKPRDKRTSGRSQVRQAGPSARSSADVLRRATEGWDAREAGLQVPQFPLAGGGDAEGGGAGA